jgi:predicted membrane protein
MENTESTRLERRIKRKEKYGGSGHVLIGVFILMIGAIGLLKSLVLPIPDWIFSWPMLLIGLGFILGLRSQFQNVTWLILMLIGSLFLMNHIYPDLEMRRYIWPLALIMVGAFLIFRPRRRNWHKRNMIDENKSAADAEGKTYENANFSSEDFIESTSIFGGIKKIVLSKKFKGGDVVNIMGGTEINLMQADINGRVILEIVQIFGGTKLIVPAHWEIKPEMVALFGGIEDKRQMQNVTHNPDKILVLKGTTMFGGIDIRNY